MARLLRLRSCYADKWNDAIYIKDVDDGNKGSRSISERLSGKRQLSYQLISKSVRARQGEPQP
jgi:hypothetical protein